MLIRLALSLLALWPACAQAQSWATRAACSVQAARVAPHVLDETRLTALRSRAAAIPNSEGRFWRIQSPDGAVSHLWGSYASNHPLILALPPIVEDRISAARVIAVDSDFTAPSRAAFERRLSPGLLIRNTPVPLSESGVHPRAAAWARSRIEGLGLGAEAADWLTHGGLAELLMRHPCEDFAAGVIPVQTQRIQTLGLIGGAEVLSLEPPEALSAALDAPEQEEAARAVLNLLAAQVQPQPDAAFRAARFALYQAGAIGTLMEWEHVTLAQAYGAAQARGDLALARGFLLGQRNAAFVKRALPDLRKGGVFLSLEAFHLPGETGMIELLRQNGFTISRIPLTGEPAS